MKIQILIICVGVGVCEGACEDADVGVEYVTEICYIANFEYLDCNYRTCYNCIQWTIHLFQNMISRKTAKPFEQKLEVEFHFSNNADFQDTVLLI